VKISVVVPVFNDPRVGRALQSILSQEHEEDLDLVVVDGGSTDETLDVVQRYRDGISVLISEPDEGIFDGLNKGIASTNGGHEDVIHFVGSDDVYADPHVLRDVMDAFRSDADLDICYGDQIYVTEGGRLVRWWKAGKFRRAKLYYGWLPPHMTLFVRRRVYEEYGTFDLRYPVSADQDLMLRLLFKHRVKVKYLPRVLMNMAPGGNSGSLRGIWQGNLDAIRIRRENGLPAALLVVPLRLLRKLFQLVPVRRGMWMTRVDRRRDERSTR